jgi:diadenosine tetraphosphate (Ap4A) HIT family hydrolase
MPVDISINAPTLPRFSWVVEGAQAGPDPVFDRVLAQTPSFVAMPTMGSLVPGWCLVVPRRRLLSLAELTEIEKVELAELRGRLSERLGRGGKAVFEFEHGAREAGTAIGCGVDQAHLHVVPLDFDLIAAVHCEQPISVVGKDATDIWRGLSDAEYVLVRRAAEEMTYGFYPELPISQFVRRVVARHIGHADRWDYRDDVGRENALATIALLRN